MQEFLNNHDLEIAIALGISGGLLGCFICLWLGGFKL